MTQADKAILMRGYIDCGWPDGTESPGAKWLAIVYDLATEAWHEGRFAPREGDVAEEDEQSVISELCDADSLHPYDHEAWRVFVDLLAYDEPEAADTDMWDSPTEWARSVLSLMAERGVALWLAAKREIEREV